MNREDEDAIFERVNTHQLANEKFNEDVNFCEWKSDDDEYSNFISECGLSFGFSDDRERITDYDFNFCPKCGKKIKEY